MQYYLLKPIDDICKNYIARFRMSSHCLNIEHGCYRNELRENRLCTFCNQNDIEDEFHFIFKCPFYSNLRQLISSHTITGTLVFSNLFNY